MVSTKILNKYENGTTPCTSSADGNGSNDLNNNNANYYGAQAQSKFAVARKEVTRTRDSKRRNRSRRANQIANANNALLPHGSVEARVENIDRAPGAYAVGPHACTGTYEGKHVPIVGVFAKASTGDTQAHVGPLHAKANGPTAGAGVHASALGVGVFANAEVGRVEASLGKVTAGLGLNFNTGASIGVDGISVSALGFGVSVGPQLAVRTPLADVSCCIL